MVGLDDLPPLEDMTQILKKMHLDIGQQSIGNFKMNVICIYIDFLIYKLITILSNFKFK